MSNNAVGHGLHRDMDSSPLSVCYCTPHPSPCPRRRLPLSRIIHIIRLIFIAMVVRSALSTHGFGFRSRCVSGLPVIHQALPSPPPPLLLQLSQLAIPPRVSDLTGIDIRLSPSACVFWRLHSPYTHCLCPLCWRFVECRCRCRSVNYYD